MERRLALVGGGTAGHVYPALAVAAAYQQAFDNIDVLCIGTPEGFEGRLVPSYGYRLAMVQGIPLYGVDLWGKLRAMRCMGTGLVQARRLLQAHGTRLVIGFGGYASAGALLAAWHLGLRTVIHEANVVPGLTNRLLGRFADRIYLGCPAARRAFPAHRTVITGNPVRPDITAVRNTIRPLFPRSNQPIRILVAGGSQGAPFLNHNIPDLLEHLARHGFACDVRHQAGDVDLEAIRTHYARAGLTAVVTSYISDMAETYGWADFVIARSGSGTLAELAACGLPALLVPLSAAAGDHQAANAATFAEAGAGWWVREQDWCVATQASRLAALFGNPEAYMAAAHSARQLATPDAAADIVTDCEAVMAGLW